MTRRTLGYGLCDAVADGSTVPFASCDEVYKHIGNWRRADGPPTRQPPRGEGRRTCRVGSGREPQPLVFARRARCLARRPHSSATTSACAVQVVEHVSAEPESPELLRRQGRGVASPRSVLPSVPSRACATAMATAYSVQAAARSGASRSPGCCHDAVVRGPEVPAGMRQVRSSGRGLVVLVVAAR